MSADALAVINEDSSFPFLIRTELGMIMKAYCLIMVKDGRHGDVVEAIKAKNLPPVKEVHAVAGTYDVVVELIGDDPRVLGKTVIEVIQKVDGVVSTVTLLAYA